MPVVISRYCSIPLFLPLRGDMRNARCIALQWGFRWNSMHREMRPAMCSGLIDGMSHNHCSIATADGQSILAAIVPYSPARGQKGAFRGGGNARRCQFCTRTGISLASRIRPPLPDQQPRLPQIRRRRRPHGQHRAGDGQVDGRAVPGHVVRW